MAVYYPPSSRFATYSPNVIQGIVGGIPSRSGGTVIDPTDYGFDEAATGADNVTALNAAVAAAVNGDVVLLPAGDFDIELWDINPTTANMEITIRGAGMNDTILHASGSVGIAFQSAVDYGNPGNPKSVITSMSAGSNTITLADGSGFPSPSGAGTYRIGRIQLQNEIVTPIGMSSHFTQIRFFSVLMVGRSGNTITLAQPLPNSFTAGATGATFELAFSNDSQCRGGFGIEDLRVDGTVAGTTVTGVLMATVFGCWLKNVRVKGVQNYCISLADLHGCEVRGCWVKGTGVLASNRGGYLVNTCSYLYAENNIVADAFPAFEINSGTTAGIFGYNFCSQNGGVLFAQVDVNHGPWNSLNLYEGNQCWIFQSDGYFGGNSQDTFFRNRADLVPILKRFTRDCSCVGNISSSFTGTGFENTGKPNIGNGDFDGYAEPSTGDWWLDWDTGTGRPRVWNATLTTRSSATSGVLTLASGQGPSLFASISQTSSSGTRLIDFGTNDMGGSSSGSLVITNVTGDVVTFNNWSGVQLPSAGFTGDMQPGPDGFQEIDGDVANTLIRKVNYQAFTLDIPVDQDLDPGDTIPNSYYLSGTPQFFTDAGSEFPPFDPFDNSTDVGGRLPAELLYLSEEPAAPPSIDTPCTISGLPIEGQTLTAIPGVVTGNPIPTRTWKWQRDGVDIGGATAQTFLLTGADVGHTIGPVQIETNSENPFTDTSTPTPLLIMPFTGDILVVSQVANAAPVTELWLRAALTSGVAGAFAYHTVQHSGAYPTQPVNNFAYKRFGTPQDQVYVFDGTVSQADAIASVP